MGEVAGLDVLHLQCHIGFDSISLARRGARVTGVDFSRASLAKARELAARAGVEVGSSRRTQPRCLPRCTARFDLVYSTMGVLCWIEDIGAWMRSRARGAAAGRQARAGGDPPALQHGRRARAAAARLPLRSRRPAPVRGARLLRRPRGGRAVATEIVYAHSLGETLTAAIEAGLRVDALHEHLDSDFDPRGSVLVAEDGGRLSMRVSGERLPVLFTLLASRRGEL